MHWQVARREFRVRTLPECFVAALHNHVLPLAQRDSSQRFRARLAQDAGVQTLTQDYTDILQETFVQLPVELPSLPERDDDSDSDPKKSVSSAMLDCATALGWLEQCAVLGQCSVRPQAGVTDPRRTKPVLAALSVEQVR